MTPNEARAEAGLPPLTGPLGDMLLIPTTVTPRAPDDPSLTEPATEEPPGGATGRGEGEGGANGSNQPLRVVAGRSVVQKRTTDARINADDLDEARDYFAVALGDDPLADLLAAHTNGNGAH